MTKIITAITVKRIEPLAIKRGCWILILMKIVNIKAIKINPNNNHYSPVVKIFGFFFTKIFAFNPFPYHFYTILIHLLNVYLVYSLSKIFLVNTSLPLIFTTGPSVVYVPSPYSKHNITLCCMESTVFTRAQTCRRCLPSPCAGGRPRTRCGRW